jgi:hypothetical protein
VGIGAHDDHQFDHDASLGTAIAAMRREELTSAVALLLRP